MTIYISKVLKHINPTKSDLHLEVCDWIHLRRSETEYYFKYSVQRLLVFKMAAQDAVIVQNI